MQYWSHQVSYPLFPANTPAALHDKYWPSLQDLTIPSGDTLIVVRGVLVVGAGVQGFAVCGRSVIGGDHVTGLAVCTGACVAGLAVAGACVAGGGAPSLGVILMSAQFTNVSCGPQPRHPGSPGNCPQLFP